MFRASPALILLFTLRAIAVPPGSDPRFNPYSSDAENLANRLHRALFLRTTPDGTPYVHSNDPLLYRGGVFLLETEYNRRALAVLDEFLASPELPSLNNPLQRVMLQRDLWAAFDYVAWYPDDWVNKSRHEPAAIALRGRLAKAIARLALRDSEIAMLADNYSLAVESHQFPAGHDPNHPDRPFLAADLFDPAGPWVRFHENTAQPMARQHFEGAGGRAAHVIFLRLPQGRAAAEKFLKDLRPNAIQQFPPGTMLAMVRKAMAIDRSNKIRPTPITELVQIRVYRRIPENRHANMEGDFGQQDVYEFILDRPQLFAGKPGLRALTPDDPAQPFARNEGDPFVRMLREPAQDPAAINGMRLPSLKNCIHCHQAPGVHSVLSMNRAFQDPNDQGEMFRTYDLKVELNYTAHAKTQQYNWGLLQGLLEAK